MYTKMHLQLPKFCYYNYGYKTRSFVIFFMEIQNKRVLVTGADGFIGSHLVELLVEEGAIVRAFVYYNSFNSRG